MKHAMKSKKKLLLLVGGPVIAMALSATAWAVWSATGAGSGGAAAAVAQSLTVNAITPTGAAANIYPGGPGGTVYFTITNPNPYAVTVTSIAWGTPLSDDTTTCPNANVSIDANAPKTGLSISVPASGTSSAFSENGVIDLLHTAPDGCQGVGFTVPMTVTGTQQ